MIKLKTLGAVAVTVDDSPAPAELLWRKNLALLVYLARSPKRTRARDHLIGLLWADKPEAAARHSLNEALRVLRRAAGEGALESDASRVTLAANALDLDVDRLESLLNARDWTAAAALVGGEFLEGFGVPDATEFETWVAAERAVWRQRGVEALTTQAEALLDAGALREARALAQRAVGLAPTADQPARVMMKYLAHSGDRAAALAWYDAHAARLAAEVGITPEAATSALAERVRRERTWRLAVQRGGGAREEGATRRTPLVGRGAVMHRLVEWWSQCRGADDAEPRATVVMIEGDPGTGKTRIVDEVLLRARLDGAATATIRAVEGDAAAAWSGLFTLAHGSAGLLDAPGLAAAPPGALATFAERVPEWAERFAGAVRGAAPIAPAQAFTDVLRAICGEQPVVLAVDDAHWLDRDTLLALAVAVRDLARAPLLLALTNTPHVPRVELDDLRSRLGRDVPGGTVRLEPLDAECLRELARWALPRYADTDLERLARRVTLDSAGLPLLAVELLHAVSLGLDLQAASGAWPAPFKTLDATIPGGLPEAIVAAIRVGFRRLSADAQKVLQVVAVVAERLPLPRIAAATGLAREPLETALDELEWGRWLTADPRGYSFLARIVREVVARDMVAPGQGQRLIEAAGPPPAT